jgi:hypothetical protein
MFLDVNRYWADSFKGRLLGSVTRQDVETFIDKIGDLPLSAKRKNSIIRAGTIPLK